MFKVSSPYTETKDFFHIDTTQYVPGSDDGKNVAYQAKPSTFFLQLSTRMLYVVYVHVWHIKKIFVRNTAW